MLYLFLCTSPLQSSPWARLAPPLYTQHSPPHFSPSFPTPHPLHSPAVLLETIRWKKTYARAATICGFVGSIRFAEYFSWCYVFRPPWCLNRLVATQLWLMVWEAFWHSVLASKLQLWSHRAIFMGWLEAADCQCTLCSLKVYWMYDWCRKAPKQRGQPLFEEQSKNWINYQMVCRCVQFHVCRPGKVVI